MKAKSLSKVSIGKNLVKLEKLTKFSTVSAKELKNAGLASPKDFKAGVITDKGGSPKYFIFDTYSLWDMLCAFDAKFEENAPAKEYVYRNPVGWLIDAIETHLPVNPKLALKLKKGIDEARKLGLVPFEKIKHELGLS
ncbi:MAG: hypothetical protein A2Y00_01675 [Omnitrophica WOR_2 bacterium GWF2_43_52]|nr:MAG: hypothetical protein A2062_06645 [Omnitrophica WOR_2 bacterium GWA2_44_7]OGX20066.1 MAG: hypothetical protein A2Y00_01675 [Omnitrophica WOR_2 bacterium GWF2_43_52]OGX55255.1 MAG: hypothetical protein A2460_05095 [Omnitrophica WOR_2 bacterium RIFOXYC2_FULL_43_9]